MTRRKPKPLPMPFYPTIAHGSEVLFAGCQVTIYGLVDPRKPLRIMYVGMTNEPHERLARHIQVRERGDRAQDSAGSLRLGGQNFG